jgi:lysophospholipase L1-like esterase
VRADTPYSDALGHGFDPGALPRETDRGGDALRGDFVTTGDSGAPFKFSVALPEGNYRVTVTLGDAAGESLTTVKAETGRLMLERIATPAARFETRAFLVNTRNARLSPGNRIKLDVREWDAAADRAVTATWDDRLTLQFSDARPCLCAIEIEPAPDAITVFLIGDSTVTDQGTEPFGTWGQQLPRWFAPPVAIANHAESGQTLKAFRFQRRWDKVMALMKPGDYVFMQFGHNDLNQRGHDAMWPTADKAGDWINTHADAATDYQWLLAAYAVEIKRRGGTPVIVSPMTKIDRRSGRLNTPGLGAYPAAAREAARLAGAALIDLNAMSEEVVRALGEKAAPLAYVDGLHTNTYGGYLYARCIVEGIRRALPALARHLAPDADDFTPARPRPLPADYKIPPDPRIELPRPPGFPPRPPAPAR